MSASWCLAALRGAVVLCLIAVLPAVAAEKKKAHSRAAKAPVVAAVPEDPRARAISACKEHVDRVMRSPTGTKHGPDDQLRVDPKGGESFTIAGTVDGLRGGTQQVHADWECDVERVGSGLMHTTTRLFLPAN